MEDKTIGFQAGHILEIMPMYLTCSVEIVYIAVHTIKQCTTFYEDSFQLFCKSCLRAAVVYRMAG